MFIINFFKRIFYTFFSICIFGLILALLTLYGPLTTLRELYVTTAMTTYSHKYLATMFIGPNEIQRIMKKNSIKESTINSDTTIITTLKDSQSYLGQMETDKYNYEKYLKEQELLKIRKAELNNIELIDIDGGTYKGNLMIVNDPSRIKLVYTKHLGSIGEKLKDICANNPNIIGGINAGGFLDENGQGWGGNPTECIIADYKIVFGELSHTYNLIGFNEDNILVLGKYTLREAQKLKIRDAIGFSPFLIINGEPMIKEGNGGWGISPRSAIGQTKDGKILLLTIDGRQMHSIGATLKDIQEILLSHGAYNAANLDGGSTSVMYLNGKLINSPSSQYGERHLPTAFVIEKR